MFYLCYWRLFAYSGVHHILCGFSSSSLPYVASFLDCPFVIAPTVFSNVYLSIREFGVRKFFVKEVK